MTFITFQNHKITGLVIHNYCYNIVLHLQRRIYIIKFRFVTEILTLGHYFAAYIVITLLIQNCNLFLKYYNLDMKKYLNGDCVFEVCSMQFVAIILKCSIFIFIMSKHYYHQYHHDMLSLIKLFMPTPYC